jgi:hypothetical protein
MASEATTEPRQPAKTLARDWPSGAGHRNGMVRLDLQPSRDAGAPSPDDERYWMTPGQALDLIQQLSKAAQGALKDQIS